MPPRGQVMELGQRASIPASACRAAALDRDLGDGTVYLACREASFGLIDYPQHEKPARRGRKTA
jgi:hypothetical protein